jgi:hypothetical protein
VFGVWGFEFGVWGLGVTFSVQGDTVSGWVSRDLPFQVWGLGLTFSGVGFGTYLLRVDIKDGGKDAREAIVKGRERNHR